MKNKFIFRKIRDGKIHICFENDWDSYLCGVIIATPEDTVIDESAIVYESIKLTPGLVFPGVCRSCLKRAINIMYGANYYVDIKKTPETDKLLDKLFDDLITELCSSVE